MEVSQYEKDINAISLGIQAKNFIKSNLGKYLIDKIDLQVTNALHNLRNANPHDPLEIQKYQNDIRVAEAAKYFLLESINEGYNAQQRLDAQEDDLQDYRYNNLNDYADQSIQGEEEWQ